MTIKKVQNFHKFDKKTNKQNNFMRLNVKYYNY